MGVEHSKLPYNVENPRRVRDLRGWTKICKEYQKQANEHFEVETFGNYTAPEFMVFMSGLMMVAMNTVTTDPERGNKLNAKWKPWISIANNSTEIVEAELWMYRPTKIMEGERITILPGEIGRLPLPKEVDFNRDYPLNGILNDRCAHFFYKNGQEVIMNCGRLNNGMSRGDFVLYDPHVAVVCKEIQETEDTSTPDDAAEAEEMQDFLAEARDPNCPQITDEQAHAIHDFIKKCMPTEVQ